jgi:hypothetical protein
VRKVVFEYIKFVIVPHPTPRTIIREKLTLNQLNSNFIMPRLYQNHIFYLVLHSTQNMNEIMKFNGGSI